MTMQISRAHAVLLLDERNTIWLYDAGSTNGTLVSGTKVRSATLAELAPFTARSRAVLGDGIEVELERPQ
jgi:pSer/pThr/pTyr-binding forkhead associated (FHA) protein